LKSFCPSDPALGFRCFGFRIGLGEDITASTESDPFSHPSGSSAWWGQFP